MHIFVDESGLFVHTTEKNSWSAIVAFALPERQLARLEKLVHDLRIDVGNGNEVKLKHCSEARYIRFLRDLSRIGGLAFAVAGDASHMPPELVQHHQRAQAAEVTAHIDKMHRQSMRDELTALGNSIIAMSPQLYIQLQLQISLFDQVIRRASLYFSQHEPSALEYFRWRIDQKNVGRPTEYEQVFGTVLAPVMQMKSIREPFDMLLGADYSFFERFDFEPGMYPDYLQTDYGIEFFDGFNAGKLLTEDFQLVDSAYTPGVQAADLLASGVRKLLRGEFDRSHEIALLMGANMVSGKRGEPPINLLSIGHTSDADRQVASVLSTIASRRKPLISARPTRTSKGNR